jgi:fatty-acyl-CoA synthase
MTDREPDMTLASVVHRRAELTPERCALRFEDLTLTYGALSDRVRRLAGVLGRGGVERRTRVGFVGHNHPAFIESLFATAQLGATFVPLNCRLTAPELRRLIDDAGVHTLVVDEAHRPAVDTIRPTLGARRYLGSESGNADWESLPELVSRAEPVTPIVVDPEDVVLIMYTSGTSGRPRGVMLTHANLFWSNVSVMSSVDFGDDEVTLAVMPLYHIGGLNVNVILTLRKGGELVLHRGFDPASALDAIETWGVTQLFAVPAVYQVMLHHPAFAQRSLSSLKLVVVGGAPVPTALMTAYHEANVPLVQGYGLTEASPVVTSLRPEHAHDKIGSAGLPVWLTEVLIVDPLDGRPLASGMRGEIVVRGPNVMRGYWGNPEATAEALYAGGELRTGDVGYVDDDGYLHVVDRIKDVVISGGENVYPGEVEAVLARHPDILDVAVIGVPDPRWGEAVVAVVVARAGRMPTLEGLRQFAAAELASFKLPRRVESIEELPRNTAGKVLKRELRARFGS